MGTRTPAQGCAVDNSTRPLNEYDISFFLFSFWSSAVDLFLTCVLCFNRVELTKKNHINYRQGQ